MPLLQISSQNSLDKEFRSDCCFLSKDDEEKVTILVFNQLQRVYAAQCLNPRVNFTNKKFLLRKTQQKKVFHALPQLLCYWYSSKKNLISTSHESQKHF